LSSDRCDFADAAPGAWLKRQVTVATAVVRLSRINILMPLDAR
jgi:hypothetical protein